MTIPSSPAYIYAPPYVNIVPDDPSGNWAGFTDDFMYTATQATVTTATTSIYADTNWAANAIGGNGSITSNTNAVTFQNPGQMLITTGATSGYGVAVYKTGDSNAPFGMTGADPGWQLDTWIQLPATITNYAFRIGICAAGTMLSDAPAEGAWLEYDTANTGLSNTYLTQRTRVSGASDYDTTLAITPTASMWVHYRVYSVVAGTYIYQLGINNSVLSAPVAVSVDIDATHYMEPFIQVLTRTSSATSLVVDRFSYYAQPGRQ